MSEDITTATIDAYVQHTMRTKTMSPRRRAKVCVREIERLVRAETGYEGLLAVPIDWEHRVPVSSMRIEQARIHGASLVPGPPDPSKGIHPITLIDPHVDPDGTVVDGVVIDSDESVALAKQAFYGEYDGNDELAEAAFNAFWYRDRD